MRTTTLLSGAAATAITVLGSLTAAPVAGADDFGIALNGSYRVISNGEFARTNDVFIDERTVVQTWTITSDCVSPIECVGEIRSDQGWTIPLRLEEYWIANREIPNWVPCPDGTSAPGVQRFSFWPFDPSRKEFVLNGGSAPIYAGRELTQSASGACGVNKPVQITMPLRLEKLT